VAAENVQGAGELSEEAGEVAAVLGRCGGQDGLESRVQRLLEPRPAIRRRLRSLIGPGDYRRVEDSLVENSVDFRSRRVIGARSIRVERVDERLSDSRRGRIWIENFGRNGITRNEYLARRRRFHGRRVDIEMQVEKCFHCQGGSRSRSDGAGTSPRTFASLPSDVVGLIAAKLSPGSRASARLVCKALDRAVVGSLDEMDVRVFLRHAPARELAPNISVHRGNVSAEMVRVPITAMPTECERTRDGRARTEGFLDLFGIPDHSPGDAGRPPLSHSISPAHARPGRWKMVGLEIVDPRAGQAGCGRGAGGILADVERLSVRATSARSSRRVQALAARVLSERNVGRLRISLPGWPGGAVFAGLIRCEAVSVLEIISTARVEGSMICKNLPAVASCGALRCLRLSWFGPGDKAICALCEGFARGSARAEHGPPGLRDLSIDCELRDGSTLRRIAETFPALTAIAARKAECSIAGIEALSRLEGLVRLELSGRMSSAWPRTAESRGASFPALREAFVSGCGATESELGWLSGARLLKTLDASDNTLSRPPVLHPEARLRHLDLSWNYLGYLSAASLAGPQYAGLRYMDVSNNKLLDYGAVSVARSVGRGRRLPQLETLLIHHNRLSKSGTAFLDREMKGRLAEF
jgi:hypothetical protein